MTVSGYTLKNLVPLLAGGALSGVGCAAANSVPSRFPPPDSWRAGRWICVGFVPLTSSSLTEASDNHIGSCFVSRRWRAYPVVRLGVFPVVRRAGALHPGVPSASGFNCPGSPVGYVLRAPFIIRYVVVWPTVLRFVRPASRFCLSPVSACRLGALGGLNPPLPGGRSGGGPCRVLTSTHGHRSRRASRCLLGGSVIRG